MPTFQIWFPDGDNSRQSHIKCRFRYLLFRHQRRIPLSGLWRRGRFVVISFYFLPLDYIHSVKVGTCLVLF